MNHHALCRPLAQRSQFFVQHPCGRELEGHILWCRPEFLQPMVARRLFVDVSLNDHIEPVGLADDLPLDTRPLLEFLPPGAPMLSVGQPAQQIVQSVRLRLPLGARRKIDCCRRREVANHTFRQVVEQRDSQQFDLV